LLGDCVQPYLPLNEQQQREFERLVTGAPYSGVQAMNVTSYDKGLDQGQRKLLRELIDHYFGPLSPAVLKRLQQLSSDQIVSLGKKVRQAQSLKDLGLED
jgi:hypothetical protein